MKRILLVAILIITSLSLPALAACASLTWDDMPVAYTGAFPSEEHKWFDADMQADFEAEWAKVEWQFYTTERLPLSDFEEACAYYLAEMPALGWTPLGTAEEPPYLFQKNDGDDFAAVYIHFESESSPCFGGLEAGYVQVVLVRAVGPK